MIIPRAIGYRFVLLTVFLTTCFAHVEIAAANASDRLVSTELLRHAGLKIVWESELPIRKGETLAQLLLLGNRVYAISSRNYVVSMDKDTGKNVFSRTVAPEGFPIAGLVLHDDTILCVGGSKLEELDIETGKRIRQVDVGFGITAPAARNSNFFYIAGTDNRLHVYRARDRVQIFPAAAPDDSTITSIVADDNFVVFSTETGYLISIAPDAPRRLWQFKAGDAIAGSVVKDWMSLFFASADTNVYRLDIVGLPEKTRRVWKYQAAAMLDKAPRVTQEVVYQRVRGKGITAIDRETGSRLWRVTGGADLLAEGKGRAYIITEGEKLVVMDNTKAKKLYSVNLAGVRVHLSNTGDDKFYIADKSGRLMCLEPAE
ncbi:MAG: PQQ-binding-like beta-propeller repeat protein [Phycisphaerales bacterium]|nr:MAG: PQQ-binding-like beta-propeller repeat protein [Phycisphaerales bacterium]